jgi:RHS repeat-associated protein
VVATALLGNIEGKPAGDLPFDTRTPTPEPTIEAIVTEPQSFLQGSTSYFHYDLSAWAARGQPVAVVEVMRQLHVHQLAPGQQSPLPIAITYRDGSGREVENRLNCGPECLEGRSRWAVSGRVRLDNKGEPVESYLPFYARSAFYGDNVPIDGPLPTPHVMRYDALGRLVLENTPKGFLRRQAHASWMTTSWDENDTVLDSPYYKSFPSDPKTPEQKREAAALAQAAQAFNTPTRTCVDPTGDVIHVLTANLGVITPDTLAPAVIDQPITPQELWDRLVADGYLEPAKNVPGAAWATARMQPYVRAFQLVFAEQYGAVAAPTLDILKETGLASHNVLDIQGRVTRMADPRLFYGTVTGGADAANFTFLLTMPGDSLRTVSADAGLRLTLKDVFDNEVLSIDGRGIQTATLYDRFARPVQVNTIEPGGTSTVTRRAELFVYGELHPDPAPRNLNGQLWQSFDDAGLETSDVYDLAGNALTPARRIRRDYALPADWTLEAIAAVEQEERLVTTLEFDAEQGRIFERAPDGSSTRFAYNLAGQIARVTVDASGETAPRTIVESASYSAFGARQVIAYGNGVVTENRYEPDTQRLLSVSSSNAAGERLQDIALTYDPIGNLTDNVDRSWEPVFCYNQQVDPASNYRYDPLYRLFRGTGRQQAGASAHGPRGIMPFCPPDPTDREQLENYIEEFTYDDGGNMVRLHHSAPRGSWTTELSVDARSNRLAGIAYDNAGNQAALGTKPLRWDFRNRLASATLLTRESGDDDTEYYLYNAAGERVLRVTRRLKQAAAGEESALYEVIESLFIGDYERTRTFQSGSEVTPFTTSEALVIPDDDGHFCVLERDTAQARTRRAVTEGQWHGRFLLTNQVASVTQETDGAGARLTYREYCPYCATAFVAAKNDAGAAASRFRFAGKRRDDATGLYYFGMRYYPPWLARWISTDPAGTVDGSNLYAYVGGNPTSFADPIGLGRSRQSKWVYMHGKRMRKPPSHATLNRRSEALGNLIATEIAASPPRMTYLKQVENKIADDQQQAGLPVHDESKVDEALEFGRKGIKWAFDKAYREALPRMDEQISTATMYYIAKGAGQVSMSDPQLKEFALCFRIASRLRLETEYTGHATKSGVIQHPTSPGSGLFGPSGVGHAYWDRFRREDIVQFGEATIGTGVDRMLGMIAEAGRHSLSFGVAPARAKNVKPVRGSLQTLWRQMKHREGLKRMVRRILGTVQRGTQRWSATWSALRTRRLSLPRVLPAGV